MSLAVYILNDIADIKVDMLNAPNRPLVSGSVLRKEACIFIIILNVIGLSIALLINLYAFLVNLSVLVLSILYSAPRIALKERFLIKTLSIGSGGVLSIIFGGVAGGKLNLLVLYTAIIFFTFIFVSSPINDLADYKGDVANGRRTIPIIIGARLTITLTIVISFSIFCFTLVSFSSLGFNILTPFLIALVCTIAIHSAYSLLKNYNDSKHVRKMHKRMVLLHLLLQASLAIGSIDFINIL